ncbi:Trichohyalin-plectin-homology domain-containing protein [Plasmodiophora brassicae]
MSSSGRGGAGVVERRRREEDVLEQYRASARSEFKLKTMAQWEQQTHASIQRNQITRIAEGIRDAHQERLERRRGALVALLAADDAVLKKELNALRETPQERRQRLRDRAAQIRADKDRAIGAYIQEQLRRQFRASSDDLRLTEGKNIALICERERRQQLELKQLAKAAEEIEKRKWDAAWEADRQAKIRHEEQEAAERSRINEMTYDQIDKQVAALRDHREMLRQQREKETADRLLAMKLDAEKDVEDHKRRQEEAARRRMDVQQFNADLRARKEAERAAEEQEQAVLLAMQDDDAARVQAMEKEEKQRLVKDMQQYLAYREAEKARAANEETQLEALRQAELAKVAQKQDLVWQKEQLARDKLMKEVLESRHMQLLEKDERLRREKHAPWQNEGLLNQLQGDGSSSADDEAEKKRKMAETLRHQMEDNRYRREMDRAERFYEMRAAQLAEQRFQEQLQKEIEHDQANLGKSLPSYGLKQMVWN